MADYGFFGSSGILSDTFAQKAARAADMRGMDLVNLIHTGQSALAIRLIESGATVNIRSMGGNWTPLSAAVAMKDAPVMHALLKAKADPLMTDAKGKTAIDIAKERGLKTLERQLKKAARAKAARKPVAAKKTRKKKQKVAAPK